MFLAAVKFKLTKAPQLTSFASSVTAAADDLGAISTTNDTNSKQLNITIIMEMLTIVGIFITSGMWGLLVKI